MTLPDLQDWRFTVDFEGIAWAVIDREGESMNSLGRRPTEELGEIVKAVEDMATRGEVKGLVLMSGKESSFIAGADIREFESFDTEDKIADVVKQTLELFEPHRPAPRAGGRRHPRLLPRRRTRAGLGLRLAHRRSRGGHQARFPRGEARHLPGTERHGALDPGSPARSTP